MSSLRRRSIRCATVAAVLAVCGAAPASAAPADGYAYISIHLHAEGGGDDIVCSRDHPSGDNGSTCRITQGVFTGGHTKPFDNRGYANVAYRPNGDGRTFVEFFLPKKPPHDMKTKEAFVEGTVPGRGSAAFTISAWNVPGIGWSRGGEIAGAAPGQMGGPLSLNVQYLSNFFGATGYDMYLSGYVYNGRYGTGSPVDDLLDELFGKSFGS